MEEAPEEKSDARSASAAENAKTESLPRAARRETAAPPLKAKAKAALRPAAPWRAKKRARTNVQETGAAAERATEPSLPHPWEQHGCPREKLY